MQCSRFEGPPQDTLTIRVHDAAFHSRYDTRLHAVRARRASLLVVVLLAAGCATPEPPKPAPAPPPPAPRGAAARASEAAPPPEPQLSPAQAKAAGAEAHGGGDHPAAERRRAGGAKDARAGPGARPVERPRQESSSTRSRPIRRRSSARRSSATPCSATTRCRRSRSTYLGDRYKFYILAKYNDISNPSKLAAGQVIKVPGRAPPVSAARPSRRARADAASRRTKRPKPRRPKRRRRAAPIDATDAAGRATCTKSRQPRGRLRRRISEAALRDPGNSDAVGAARRDRGRSRDVTSARPRRRIQRQNLDEAINKWDRVLALEPNNQKAKLERERAIDLRKKTEREVRREVIRRKVARLRSRERLRGRMPRSGRSLDLQRRSLSSPLLVSCPAFRAPPWRP